MLLIFTQHKALASELIEFNITAQKANQAILEFAQQANQNILFSYQEVQSFNTNAIKGYYSTEYALKKLLRDSGLIFITSEQGKFTIKKSPVTASKPQSIQPKQPSSSSNKASIEKIAIVGSRVSDRSITDLPVAVDVFDQRAIQSTGHQELGDVLQALAPSFNFSSSAISDGSDAFQPATLRGLGPDQTLLLINGKRRHQASLIHINNSVGRGTTGVDINALPIAAISSIEVLRDGAAAQYGSDAIAGVINLVLKDNHQSEAIDLSYGQYSKGDGETTALNIHQAFGSNALRMNVTLAFQEHGDTNRAGKHGSCQFYGCSQLGNGDYVLGDIREKQVNRDTFEVGDSYYQQFTSVINTTYQSRFGKFYGFATLSKRNNRSAAFFRHHADEYNNPILQDGEPTIPYGYLPKIETDISDHSFNIGNKMSTLAGGVVDISYTYGKNTIDYTTTDSINASFARLQLIQNSHSAKEIRANLTNKAFAYGLSLSLQTLNIDYRQHFELFHLATGIELRQDRYKVNAGEEYSYQDYDHSQPIMSFSSFNNNAGIQGFPGIPPSGEVNEKRNIYSAYIDTESYISDNILLTGAIRYDNGDGFGDTLNVKLASHWQPFEALAFRGAINTGFRAPAMQQMYFNNVSNQYLVNNNQQLVAERVKTFRNDSNAAHAIGINSLEEEKSVNFSLGAVYTANETTNITLDLYQIDIDDRIVISNKLGGELSTPLASALYQQKATKGQFFLNGANTQTQGADVVLSWLPKTPYGTFTLDVGANYSETEVTDLFVSKNSVLSQIPEHVAYSKKDISIIEQWQPKTHINMNSHYAIDQWNIALSMNYFGHYTLTDGDSQRYGAELITNIKVQYSLSEKLAIYLGGNNIFGVTPDKNKIGNSAAGTIVDNQGQQVVKSNGVFTYSRRSAPFGFNGAYFYAGLKYQL